jgi:ABC-type oligopeptide transport system ATPase subunit
MQIIFQDPYSSRNSRMRVRDILAEPFQIHGQANGNLRAKIADLLDLVGLDHSAGATFPHEFSGGRRQRIVIARAIALHPHFVVCDEPLSALDVSIQAQIINLLRDLQRELGLAYLFISHDLSVVRYLTDRVAVMYLGRVVELGPKADVFAAPLHPYTQSLMCAIPVPHPLSTARAEASHAEGRRAQSPAPSPRLSLPYPLPVRAAHMPDESSGVPSDPPRSRCRLPLCAAPYHQRRLGGCYACLTSWSMDCRSW